MNEFIFITANLTIAQNIIVLRHDELQKIGTFSSEDVEQIFLAAAERLVKPNDFHG